MPPVLRIVDLSHPVENGMQVYPGDPVPSITPASTLDRDGVNVLHLSMGSQTGTHVDAPYHFLADGARLDALDLSMFLAPATVVDVRGRAPRSPIRGDDVAPHVERMPRGAILVLHTGWSRHWGAPAYLDHPHLDVDAARRIVAAGSARSRSTPGAATTPPRRGASSDADPGADRDREPDEPRGRRLPGPGAQRAAAPAARRRRGAGAGGRAAARAPPLTAAAEP